MSATLLNYALRVFCVIGVLTFAAKVMLACSCGPRPSVLEAFDRVDVVVIVRVSSVDTVDPKVDSRSNPANVRSATAIVEKVYKGNLKVRDEIVLEQGSGSNCIMTFNDNYVGHEFLFYLWTPQLGNRWAVNFCARSNSTSGAKEDLLYLDNLEKRCGKTRVSGTLGEWNSEDFQVANKKILFIGEKKTYETKTDDDGVYEIYDLPAGTYKVQPEILKGWRIDRSWLHYVSGISEQQDSTQSIRFELADKQHVSINISFEPENAVEGRVVGPDGNAMAGICVYLWTLERTKYFGPHDCTDDKGYFRIESIPPNSYHLVINTDGRPSSKYPFPQTFYPGVTDRKKAALITVNDGDTVKGINVVIPKVVETVTLEGVLLYSDDRPVTDGDVKFESTSSDIDGDQRASVDKQGRFRLELVKGVKGVLLSNFYGSIGRYENCSKLDALIKETGKNFAEIKTEPITIEASENIQGLVLKFPFPMCKQKE